MKTKAAIVSGLLVVVSAMIWPATPAASDAGMTAYGHPLPDTGEHSYCYSANPARSPNNEITTRFDLAMATVEYQTIVETTYVASCASYFDVDVLVDQGFIEEGTLGEARCVRERANGRCNTWSVTIAWGEIRQYAGNRLNQIRKTSCHEIGHTLSVWHYANSNASPQSCMRSGVWDDAVWWQWSYGSHHIDDHINPHWS